MGYGLHSFSFLLKNDSLFCYGTRTSLFNVVLVFYAMSLCTECFCLLLLASLKTTEIAQVRLEEKEKYQREVQHIRKQVNPS